MQRILTAMSTHVRKQVIPLLCIAACLLAFAALLEASDNSSVNIGANQNITAHAVCKKITNNSATGLSVYVPTQTDTEWQSFYTHLPQGVTAGSCCAGVVVGGYCWYLSAPGESCTTACTSHGGCNLEGTRNYTGSGGNFTQCIEVMSALGQNVNVTQYDNYNGWADGCNMYYSNTYPGWYLMRSSDPPTTCEFSYGGAYGFESRACACNN